MEVKGARASVIQTKDIGHRNAVAVRGLERRRRTWHLCLAI